MLKNKVHVLVDGVPTMALVDTGTTISVMSVNFKNLLGLMLCISHGATLRGVRWEFALWTCSKVFPTEFAVIARSTHDIILGIDFLRECGATVDCRSGHLSVHGSFPAALLENSSRDEGIFFVSEDTVVPAFSAACVPVICCSNDLAMFDALTDSCDLCEKEHFSSPLHGVCS